MSTPGKVLPWYPPTLMTPGTSNHTHVMNHKSRSRSKSCFLNADTQNLCRAKLGDLVKERVPSWH